MKLLTMNKHYIERKIIFKIFSLKCLYFNLDRCDNFADYILLANI